MPAALLLTAIATLWLAHSFWNPYRACRGCGGTKRGPGSGKRSWNHCPFCGGSGEAIRAGAWLISRVTRRPPRNPRRRRR